MSIVVDKDEQKFLRVGKAAEAIEVAFDHFTPLD
jgi:hypothetical protein